MKADSEALRLHVLLRTHTIQATTERFRPDRAAELDDSVVKQCGCGDRYVPPHLCPTCTTLFQQIPVSLPRENES